MRHPDRGCVGAGGLERVLELLRHHDPRHLVVQAQREAVAREREDRRRAAARPKPPIASPKLVERVEVVGDLRHSEARAGRRPSSAAGRLPPRGRRALWFTATPTKNEVGASIGRPLKSSPRFRPAIRRVSPIESISYTPCEPGIVADLGWVARDGEDVPDTFRVRAEELRLDAEDARVARRQVRDRLETRRALDRAGDHQRVDAGAGRRVVVDVDELDEPRGLELAARPRADRGSSRRAAGRAAPKRRTRLL